MKLQTAVLLTTALAVQACSSVSKETYTETRTLNYPKGGVPHLKDFYLTKQAETPATTTANYIGLPDNDVLPTHQQPQNLDAELDRLHTENAFLQAQAYNAYLKNNQ